MVMTGGEGGECSWHLVGRWSGMLLTEAGPVFTKFSYFVHYGFLALILIFQIY